VRDVVLEMVDARVAALLHRAHRRVHLALLVAQGLQLPTAIVDDPYRRSEAQFQGAPANRQCVLRMVDAAAHHGVDVHVKLGVFGEQLQFPVEQLEALLGHLVGHHVVDRDLEVIEPRAVEPLDAFGGQQVAVGDHPRDHSVAADAGDDCVQAQFPSKSIVRRRKIVDAMRLLAGNRIRCGAFRIVLPCGERRLSM